MEAKVKKKHYLGVVRCFNEGIRQKLKDKRAKYTKILHYNTVQSNNGKIK